MNNLNLKMPKSVLNALLIAYYGRFLCFKFLSWTAMKVQFNKSLPNLSNIFLYTQLGRKLPAGPGVSFLSTDNYVLKNGHFQSERV